MIFITTGVPDIKSTFDIVLDGEYFDRTYIISHGKLISIQVCFFDLIVPNIDLKRNQLKLQLKGRLSSGKR